MQALDRASGGAQVVACSLAELPPGGVRRVQAGSQAIAVANVDGRLHAVDDLCSHGNASLSEGFLEGHVLECPFHGGAFDVRTGQAVRMPCMRAVRTWPVLELDGKVIVVMRDGESSP